MTKRKRRRIQEPETPVAAFVRRHSKWARRLSIAAGLIAVAAAVFFIADPFGGTPTAIDESGEEVRVGIIDREGAEADNAQLPPNFVLPDYDQQAVRLDEFEGKAVFVNFWASWCGPCEREMPDIIRTAEQYPDDVVVLAVNRGESVGTARGWTRGHNFAEDLPNFHWLVDERETVWREYERGFGFPQSVFIGPDGRVQQHVGQAMEYEQMVANVEQALTLGTIVIQE